MTRVGVSGGIVTISAGQGRLGAFAPLLDCAGNSVKGQKVTSSCQNGWD